MYVKLQMTVFLIFMGQYYFDLKIKIVCGTANL